MHWSIFLLEILKIETNHSLFFLVQRKLKQRRREDCCRYRAERRHFRTDGHRRQPDIRCTPLASN